MENRIGKHPLQRKIDNGEFRPRDNMDVTDEEFERRILKLNDEDKNFAIEIRQLWKAQKLMEQTEVKYPEAKQDQARYGKPEAAF